MTGDLVTTMSIATPSAVPNAALVGGVVGGILAIFLLVGAVIAFIVYRRRQSGNASPTVDSIAEPSGTTKSFHTNAENSNNSNLNSNTSANYGTIGSLSLQPPDDAHYSTLTQHEI